MQIQSKPMAFLTSQVGRKILTGVTGVLLVIFIIGHLAGNLTLLKSDPDPFNSYGHFLHQTGALLYLVEIGLAVTILLHAFIGISIFLRKQKARKNGYVEQRSKGKPSKQSVASRTMIITGSVLLIFLVIHLIQFRFGPDVQTMIEGESVHDLHLLVRETFSSIWWVIFYVGTMILLGFHLRHGVWSALQSLGAMKPGISKPVYGLALILGLLLAVGFLILPVFIYLREHNIL